MPTTVEDLVWYIMCFIVTTGLPTVVVIAWNIQKLLRDLLVKQVEQSVWIIEHEKIHQSLNTLIEKLSK